MPLRAAVVLHGKLGSLDRGTGAPTRSVDGATPGLDLLVMCYATLVRHIMQPNVATHAVDVIAHSWNPPVGPVLDALYRPRISAHEPEEISRNRALCIKLGPQLRDRAAHTPNTTFHRFGAVGRGTSSCERTASHLLGMQRAILLKARAERQGGFTYDLVLVARWDVIWNRPVALPGAHGETRTRWPQPLAPAR
jgi:hypothetical protein